MEDPFAAPDFVHAASVDECNPPLKLLSFPGGVRFYTHSSLEESELIYNEVFARDEYERGGLALDRCRCIIDVGANLGLFTLFAKRRSPDAQIYAFEAIKETYDVLAWNLALYGFDHVVHENVAIGSADGATRIFTFYPKMTGNSTAHPGEKRYELEQVVELYGTEIARQYFQAEKREAPVRTLSSIIREYNIGSIDYLKIDVEGDEMEVLSGIQSEQFGLIRQIGVEVHTAQLFREVRSLLTEHGFKVSTAAGVSEFVGVTNLYAVRP